MDNVTWTIRVRNLSSQRKFWGDDLDQCWSKLRHLATDLTPDKQIILKLHYHGNAQPPDQVRAGIIPFQIVSVFFSHQCEDHDHRWYVRAVDTRQQSNCSDWNVADVDQFIAYYIK